MPGPLSPMNFAIATAETLSKLSISLHGPAVCWSGKHSFQHAHGIVIELILPDQEVVHSILGEPLLHVIPLRGLVGRQEGRWRHLLHLHPWTASTHLIQVQLSHEFLTQEVAEMRLAVANLLFPDAQCL